MKKIHYLLIAIIILLVVIGVAFTLIENSTQKGEGPSYNASALSKLSIDMNNWNYDETNDIYYQIGLIYYLNPEDTTYESCGIKVGKDNVEFSTVWGQGHTQAERTGDSTSNFINWVNGCLN